MNSFIGEPNMQSPYLNNFLTLPLRTFHGILVSTIRSKQTNNCPLRRQLILSEKINVLIVDDHPLFRQGLRDVLDTDNYLHVIGDAADGDVALKIAKELEPDVILMDINLPTINGLQATRNIKLELPDTQVIIITGYDDYEQALHALRAGASGYCAKDVTPDVLTEAIRAVVNGRYIFDNKEMTANEIKQWEEQKIGRFSKQLPKRGKVKESFVPLSPREMEILEHVTKGQSNKEIALSLGISHQTVKNHMTAILRKMQVDDRTQAAVYALRHGWVHK